MKQKRIQKLYLLIAVIFFGTTAAFGQRIVELSLVMEPNNNVRLSVQSLFFYGNGQTNFGQLYGHTMWQSNDTIKLNIYYNAPPAPTQHTGYVDTVEMGTVMPHSANVLTVYPYFLTQITATDWDTTAFFDLDSTILFPWTTSLAEVSSENHQVRVFPVPATDRIHIRFPGRDKHSIELFDITGRKVFTQQSVTEETTIDVSGLSAGSYMVRVATADRVYVQKIIVGR